MFQYYIIEIQKYFNGEYGHLVHWAFDADADIARQKAESKYHTVLAAAAISNTAMHSATIISSEGVPLMNQCYHHPAPEPEPTPEPEEA